MPLPFVALAGRAVLYQARARLLQRAVRALMQNLVKALRALEPPRNKQRHVEPDRGPAIIVKVHGLADLRRELKAVPGELRKHLRQALMAGARQVRDDARRAAPVLRTSTRHGASALSRGVRAAGTLRKSIVARTSKLARRRGDVGVFVNVKPLRGAGRSGNNPKDPFYWRWMEFGWRPGVAKGGVRGRRREVPGRRFLQGAASRLQSVVPVIEERLSRAVATLNTRR